MFECGTCRKAFPAGSRARDNHCRSTGHEWPDLECNTCDRCFGSENARLQHMRHLNHFGGQQQEEEDDDDDDDDDDDNDDDEEEDEECFVCMHSSPTEEDIKNHEVIVHHYCRDCNRQFENHNNIRMHLNSQLHRGQTVGCPFCSRAFSSATGVSHHLESGSCPKARGLNCDEVYRIVRSKDPHGIIAKRLIGWTGDSDTYEATDRAWNGSEWECYFCHRCFSSIIALNQHMNSPAHRQELYHCPNRSCHSEFKTLAATINHLESEACGAMRFETVQRHIGGIISGSRLIGF
ncbi:hypothetical protein B0H67DRAFT_94285 [Lasiosphaeris hirsuta]|uniref:C2H2-type domain-containing protein n=1 Tax=Lasiosphaeris hirsuta TaxID=260670 RepID=A0AA40BDC9_9PEZI|nr:hypothetical protein B0H67DRAFT_94285 [Lasiosphaeris hirsuta]